MTDVEMMLRAIDAQPEDLTTFAALVDALMQERDMTRSEAEKHAERAVQTAYQAREMTQAAALLRPDAPWFPELVGDVFDACLLPRNSTATVVVVAGWSPPVSVSHYRSNPGAFWYETTVTVGAAWVMRHYRANPSLWMMSGSRKPIPKPKSKRGAR